MLFAPRERTGQPGPCDRVEWVELQRAAELRDRRARLTAVQQRLTEQDERPNRVREVPEQGEGRPPRGVWVAQAQGQLGRPADLAEVPQCAMRGRQCDKVRG